ncbi:hypothetical protein GCM10009624_28700 [Gordonia sinesedis]
MRSRNRIATMLAAGVLVFALGACGNDQNTDSAATSSATQTASQTADDRDDQPSTSPPVVGGPRHSEQPQATGTDDADDGAVAGDDRVCGKSSGPDGPLRVIVRDDDVTCADAQRLAEQYGPKIATGQPQTIDGWSCKPSSTPGVLASCGRGDDDDDIAFAP